MREDQLKHAIAAGEPANLDHAIQASPPMPQPPMEVPCPRLGRFHYWGVLIAGIGVPAGAWLIANSTLGDFSGLPCVAVALAAIALGIYMTWWVRCPTCGKRMTERATSADCHGYFCSSCNVVWNTLIPINRNEGG